MNGAKRHGRAAQAAAVAPIAPPCFSSRDQWVEYVVACAIDQREGHVPGPLLAEEGKAVLFNPNFSMCQDCNDRHAAQMAHQGKCKPRYLIELFAAKPAPTSKPAKETA